MVRENDKLKVELLEAQAGDKIDIKTVLAFSDGKTLQIGTPSIKDAKITCTVIDHIKAKKVVNFKKKRRKGYRRKIGHRQQYTVLEVNSVK